MTERDPTTAAPPEHRNGTPEDAPDAYRSVIVLLSALATAGIVAAIVGARLIQNNALFGVAVAFGVAVGILAGVIEAQAARTRRATEPELDDAPVADAPVADAGNAALSAIVPGEPHAETEVAQEVVETPPPPTPDEVATTLFPELGKSKIPRALVPSLSRLQATFDRRVDSLGVLGIIGVSSALIGFVGVVALLVHATIESRLPPLVAAIAAVAALAAGGLIVTAARYLADLDPSRLPEAPGLSRGARVAAWLLLLAALSIGLQSAGLFTLMRVVHLAIEAIIVAVCWSLLMSSRDGVERRAFPVDLGPFAVLGSRPNIVASLLDAAQRQLGIDLRSTWALTVVRRSLEPLAIGLFLLAWFSTALTVVGVEEQGLIERWGVPVGGPPLTSGLHVHWPWPVDHVYRFPVRRVQALAIGHEGEEAPGPENVLWSVEHAPNEFTLVLGNGRDLITIDAAVQYRIVDATAWRYHVQNPADALHALAYRAVMRNTVNRTLSEALSENVAALAERMRRMVQSDADSLRLGVQIVGFTVGGMHPPVAVAGAYEAVVSAQISKVTAVVNAQAYRNQVLPAAQDTVLVRSNAALAERAESMGRAAGEAWSFRVLEAQYRAAPTEYFYRRRLETLEQSLPGRGFVVVDSRFVRDGGELWIVP
jgi:regulator of protease activity HflC (stomatin/prohibitin superfamily)